MQKMQYIWQTMKESVLKKFKSATITYLMIMLVVYGFQIAFGSENTVLGLIIAPMMLILMARDMTAQPIRHFLIRR